MHATQWGSFRAGGKTGTCEFMPDSTEILLDNLKQTFQAIEKYLMIGLTASFVLVALASTDRSLLGSAKVMFADISAPAQLVWFVAWGVWEAAGLFAALSFWRRMQILEALKEQIDLVKASLLYPSIAAQIGIVQVMVLGVAGLPGMGAIWFLAQQSSLDPYSILAMVLAFGAPYLAIFGMVLTAYWRTVRAQT